MKRTAVVLGLVGVLVAAVAMAGEIKTKGFDLIAPIVYGIGNAPDQVGSVIFDSNTNAFYGKGQAGSGVWQALTNDPTTQIPPGTIIPYVGRTAPTGWVLCDGANYPANEKPGLAAVIWDSVNSKYAFGGTGSYPDGTFNVPDLRGRFLRGWNNGAPASTHDPDIDLRTFSGTGGNIEDNIGSIQADQLRSHQHTLAGAVASSGAGGSFFAGNSAHNIDPTTSATGGSETRPVNVYVNYIIKL